MLGALSIITGNFIGGMWLFLIGMFLRGAAATSYQQVVARTTLKGMPVSRMMTPQPISVSPDVSLADFIEDFVYHYHHRSLPVTSDGNLIGSVGTEQVARVDRADRSTAKVRQIMVPLQREDVVAPDSDALAALMQMQRTGKSRLWVVEQGKLVGILSLRDVMDLLTTILQLEHNRQALPPSGKHRP